ncbi:hypothetical protein GCM10023320_10930 [Pseudonocardia adelaidensis]|uniref:Uncharacterized protein n=1 Tax=Pseudonocardia adelaidensis TaxID=648754 RepID=A0ABP9NBY4_9PSEU
MPRFGVPRNAVADLCLRVIMLASASPVASGVDALDLQRRARPFYRLDPEPILDVLLPKRIRTAA